MASLFPLSLPIVLVCALTLRIMTSCLEALAVARMWAISSLSGWLYFEEGSLMWLSKRYMLLMVSIKINVSMVKDLMCSIAMSSA